MFFLGLLALMAYNGPARYSADYYLEQKIAWWHKAAEIGRPARQQPVQEQPIQEQRIQATPAPAVPRPRTPGQALPAEPAGRHPA